MGSVVVTKSTAYMTNGLMKLLQPNKLKYELKIKIKMKNSDSIVLSGVCRNT